MGQKQEIQIPLGGNADVEYKIPVKEVDKVIVREDAHITDAAGKTFRAGDYYDKKHVIATATEKGNSMHIKMKNGTEFDATTIEPAAQDKIVANYK